MLQQKTSILFRIVLRADQGTDLFVLLLFRKCSIQQAVGFGIVLGSFLDSGVNIVVQGSRLEVTGLQVIGVSFDLLGGGLSF